MFKSSNMTKKENFKKLLIIAFLTVIVSGCGKDNASTNKTNMYEEGVHYKKLEKPIEELNADVTNFFWFGCSHCNEFRKHLSEWQKENQTITVEKVHSTISKGWIKDKVLYQIIKDNEYESNGLHATYDYFHERKGKNVDLVDFLNMKGINAKDEHFNISKEKQKEYVEKIRNTSEMERKIGALGVPYVLVKGEYLVINTGFNSYEEMLEGVKWILKNK